MKPAPDQKVECCPLVYEICFNAACNDIVKNIPFYLTFVRVCLCTYMCACVCVSMHVHTNVNVFEFIKNNVSFKFVSVTHCHQIYSCFIFPSLNLKHKINKELYTY